MKEKKFVEEFKNLKNKFLKSVFVDLKKFNTKDELENYFFGCGSLESSPLIEEIFVKSLKEGFVINSFYLIKSIPLDSYLRIHPEYLDLGFSGKLDEAEQEEVFSNLILQKGVLYKVLESLNLMKSKNWLIMYNIIEEPELNEKLYYSSDELNSFEKDNFQNLLFEELEQKYGDKSLFVKINN